MTTVQTMLARTAIIPLILACALFGAGCATKGERKLLKRS